jgi:hypothetical protein
MTGLSPFTHRRRRVLAPILAIAVTLVAGSGLWAGDRDDLETRRMRIADESFTVELAVTPADRRRGLMHRAELPAGHGMLFVYAGEGSRAFWMKNVGFPIDILFLDRKGALVDLSHRAPPCRRDPCPTYRSDAPARYVLELPAGTAERLDLQPGRRLALPDALP